VEYGYVPYCFNLVWVALAVTSVWLVKVSIEALDVKST
jgi:hypothetical protein